MATNTAFGVLPSPITQLFGGNAGGGMAGAPPVKPKTQAQPAQQGMAPGTMPTFAQLQQQGQARLIAAWLAGPHPSQVAERNWQRRKKAVLFLVGSKFRPMQRDAAAAKLAQEQVDKHAKLPGIPRRSKEENLAYLHKEVFGHEGIQRCLVGML